MIKIILAIVLLIIGFFVFKSIMHVEEVYTPTVKTIEEPAIEQNGCGEGVEDCKG